MTVAELIKLLEQQYKDALVFVPSSQDGEETPVTEVEAIKARVNAHGTITAFYYDSGDPERDCVFIK